MNGSPSTVAVGDDESDAKRRLFANPQSCGGIGPIPSGKGQLDGDKPEAGARRIDKMTRVELKLSGERSGGTSRLRVPRMVCRSDVALRECDCGGPGARGDGA